MAMAEAATAPTQKGPSFVLQIAMLAGLTVAALGMGWGAGAYLKSQQAAAPRPAPAATADPVVAGSGLRFVTQDLPPITTNMAAPTETWVRMDLSLLLEAPLSTELASAVHQDLLAFMRSVRMHQVEGPSGFRHLKADLRERASMRSGGKVRDVLIRTLVYE
jgi:flagellar FliL protein